jgi:hypothetical protein
MVNQPRRQRRSRPVQAPARAAAGYQPVPSEWRVRLAWALVVVSVASLLANLLAVVALAGAIAHLGVPQGPLEFALILLGAVAGLIGDVLIARGSMAVALPGYRLAGAPARVPWGLGLQLPAAIAVGVLQSSWLFAVVYVLMLAGLAFLWLRTSPPVQPSPSARHPRSEAAEPPARAQPVEERYPMPWVGTAPPPPSAWGAGNSEQASPDRDLRDPKGAGRGPDF